MNLKHESMPLKYVEANESYRGDDFARTPNGYRAIGNLSIWRVTHKLGMKLSTGDSRSSMYLEMYGKVIRTSITPCSMPLPSSYNVKLYMTGLLFRWSTTSPVTIHFSSFQFWGVLANIDLLLLFLLTFSCVWTTQSLTKSFSIKLLFHTLTNFKIRYCTISW